MIYTSCSGEIENNTVKEQNQEVSQDKGKEQDNDQEQDDDQEQEKVEVEASKKDSNINSDNASNMNAETKETDLPVEGYESEAKLSKDFLQRYYDFTEKTSAIVFQENIGENQIYAPINYYLALSMLSELSGGEAREEIQEVLRISDNKLNASELNIAIHTLEKNLGKFGRLNVNTSLWLNDELNYQEELLTKLRSQYGTEVYKGDLKNSEFQNRMKKWVYDNTNHEFMPDYNDSLDKTDPYTFISLNTLDFYDEWAFPFEVEDTTAEPFILSDNNEITCDFMKLEKAFYPYMVGENYISTICMLKDNESMLFILPEEGLTVEDLINERSKLSGIISDWTNEQFTMSKVKLSVPKFAYDSESDLEATAEAMGIKKIFDKNSKAFSEFSDSNIYVTDILQASKIKIDEKGCSASSYTEIIAQGAGLAEGEVEINLNRPFIYVLIKNKVPFLVGIIQNPLKN